MLLAAQNSVRKLLETEDEDGVSSEIYINDFCLSLRPAYLYQEDDRVLLCNFFFFSCGAKTKIGCGPPVVSFLFEVSRAHIGGAVG